MHDLRWFRQQDLETQELIINELRKIAEEELKRQKQSIKIVRVNEFLGMAISLLGTYSTN